MIKAILISTMFWALGQLSAQGFNQPNIYNDVVNAQNSDDHTVWRWSFGVGVSGFGGAGCITTGFGLSFQNKHNLFTCRYMHHEEIALFGEGMVYGNDLAVLCGKTDKSKHFFTSASAGISCLGGCRRGKLSGYSGAWFSTPDYEKISFSTIGVPIEGELFWTPTPNFGIGIRGFANVNLQASYGGVLFCLEFRSN